METIIWFGVAFEQLIKYGASFLASDGFAGIICLLLLAVLSVLVVIYIRQQGAVSQVIIQAIEILSKARDREEFFAEIEIRKSLNAFASSKNKNFSKSFGRAWQEYSETLVDSKDGDTLVRNTVRPHGNPPICGAVRN